MYNKFLRDQGADKRTVKPFGEVEEFTQMGVEIIGCVLIVFKYGS